MKFKFFFMSPAGFNKCESKRRFRVPRTGQWVVSISSFCLGEQDQKWQSSQNKTLVSSCQWLSMQFLSNLYCDFSKLVGKIHVDVCEFLNSLNVFKQKLCWWNSSIQKFLLFVGKLPCGYRAEQEDNRLCKKCLNYRKV